MTIEIEHKRVVLDDDIASRWGPRTVDFVKVIVEGLTKVASK